MKNKVFRLALGIASIGIAALSVTGCPNPAGGGGGGGSGGGGDTPTSFTSVSAFENWLSAQPANTPATAYTVKLNVSDISTLKTILNAAPVKYVYLDLSGSAITAIPKNVFFGTSAPYGCGSLTGIIIPDTVTSIEEDAFSNCASLASVTIPNGVTSIGGTAFRYCSSLTSVIIPNGVTNIGNSAFYHCTSLKSVTIIGNGVASIGEFAFQGCTSLASVSIGGVASIERGAFYECTSLANVTFQGSIPSSGFSNTSAFFGDLRDKYLAGGGGIGTYTTTAPVSASSTWTKQ